MLDLFGLVVVQFPERAGLVVVGTLDLFRLDDHRAVRVRTACGLVMILVMLARLSRLPWTSSPPSNSSATA